ncbi:CAP domain-containing protein [Elsinoe ampelina]|uniref:CAP domain-containing protein n=1 Tax=Elsinoe ampelina TaxID=302913 RepID=A0A6A6G6R9_9PEZI|nr:CAP domain-containing protein [Elsinoe ampelina]
MRSSVLFTAAFAAVALASPAFDKRGEVVVTDAEVVYVTEVVTVTEGQPAPTAEPTYTKTAYGGWRKKGRKGRKTGGYGSAPAPVPTEPAPVPSSAEVPAPAPSTYEPAPQPEPTTEAPALAPTSYEQPAPAPTSYEQPAPAPSTTEAAPPPAYTPVSSDQQAPLHIQTEMILSDAPAQALSVPAPAPAPQSSILHRLLPFPLSVFGFSAPDCHSSEEEVHLHKRGTKVQTKKKVAKTNKKQKKKKASTTKKANAKATKAPSTPATSKDTSKDTTSQSTASSTTATASKDTATKTSSKPASGKATTYQQAVLNHHNYHRANHSAPDIAWSQSLADTALKIAKTCVYEHNTEMDGGGYGYVSSFPPFPPHFLPNSTTSPRFPNHSYVLKLTTCIQNIAAGIVAGKISTILSDMFYNGEVEAYGGVYGQNPSMTNFGTWGHFSQMVWKSTTEVGCATYDCGSSATGVLKNYGGIFTVCNYNPAGNYQGQYDTQVGQCLNQPTIDGTYNVDVAAIQADAEARFQ